MERYVISGTLFLVLATLVAFTKVTPTSKVEHKNIKQIEYKSDAIQTSNLRVHLIGF